ncbi:hypothetical protein [Arthrobacter roseus]|uniref:hypothetical protein n=1 Tax=Arthrobacter roseus TaxID=136274 RepID=UPI0019669B70|nr:hypothetical protein [Arthrobacter roseus]MBM7848034.1 O-antigen/teichoic acid export membrane protein [Arthrobacter roseus]
MKSTLPFSFRGAAGALGAQSSQAAGSFVMLTIAARTLDLEGLGRLAVLYGVLVLCAALASGFVGDSLTVLDRASRPLRAGLELWLLILGGGSAVVVPFICLITGFTSPVESLLLSVLIATFVGAEIMRRVLMANLLFPRIVVSDTVSLVIGVVVIVLWAGSGQLSLAAFLLGFGLGRLGATVCSILLIPASERFLVPLREADWRAVAAYGSWRAAQATLRPALMTGIRLSLVFIVALAAAGQLEIARIYAAPAMLCVGGMSSYLFASFARAKTSSMRRMLAQADRGVVILLLATMAITAVALAALPVTGELLTGSDPDFMAVLGWLAYATSAAAVTPYGALAAVRASPRRVFTIRLLDTTVSLGAVVVVLQLTGAFELAPLVAAIGSVAGGIALRFFLLAPLARVDEDNTFTTSLHGRQLGTHV